VQQFVAKHAEHVIGTVSGFDRLVFRGTMRALCSRSGLLSYLWAVQVRLTDEGARQLNQAVLAQRHALARMAEGIPPETITQMLEVGLRIYLGVDYEIKPKASKPSR